MSWGSSFVFVKKVILNGLNWLFDKGVLLVFLKMG